MLHQTEQYQKHISNGFCYHIKCFDYTLYSQQPVTFVKDVEQIIIDTLAKNIREFIKGVSCEENMIITKQDKLVYDNFTLCDIYNKELGKYRVRDQCHLSGKFRGAAHEVCKLKYTVPKSIPVVYHNLSGSDSHLFIKTLGNREGDISCIPHNEGNNILHETGHR